MSHSGKLPFSPALIVLDAIGSVLIGFALAEKFAKTNFVPHAWQFENYEWVMIGVGVAILIPAARMMISSTRQARRQV